MKIHAIDLHFQGIEKAIASYLIETSEGPVLVETGPHSSLDALKDGIHTLGFQPADIRHIFLTHIHLDHAGLAWYFAKLGATVHVHPFGQPHLAAPEKLMKSAKRIYQDDMDRLWGEMHPIAPEMLDAVADGEEITVGKTVFKAWHTPGHAVHHIAWQVGDSLFTGDVGGVKIGDGLVCPPCPPPDINLEDWMVSLNKIREIAPKKLCLTHFGSIMNIDEHLEALEQELFAWADWMRIRFDQQQEQKEIVPAFQQFVAERLKKQGADEKMLEQYEAANPSWMSVAGLMRYWKKKLAVQ